MAEENQREGKEVTIIVDTNVIISALMTKGVVRELIVYNPEEFITPDWCYQEVFKHQSVWNKNKLGTKEIESILRDMMNYFVYPIEKEIYQDKIRSAKPLIKDADDVPVIALALSVETKGIWTFNTKHFSTKQVREQIKILTTDDVKTLFQDHEEQ